MEIVQQTVDSLGPPVWVQSLEAFYGPGALMARWRHGSARVAIKTADAIRVILNLSSTQQVRHAEQNRVMSARGLPGHVSIFPAGVPTETVVVGEADVVQIFIPPESLGGAAGNVAYEPLFESTSEELKLSAVQLLVAMAQSNIAQRESAEIRLRRIVAQLLEPPLDSFTDEASRSYPPFDLGRVEQVIEAAINGVADSSPSLKELAAAAHLSVSHFIRTFRNTVGTTPHQLVIARRNERAMDLLRQLELTIADVAEYAGYRSAAHFVASFRQRLGVTPGSYRKALGDDLHTFK